MKSGELRAVHIGSCCRLSRAELKRYVNRLEGLSPDAALVHRPPAGVIDVRETDDGPTTRSSR